MRNTHLFVWILFLTLYVTSSYCMQGTGDKAQLVITAQQQSKYKKMCEWLETSDEEKFVIKAVKAGDSDQLRWEAQENRLNDVYLASYLDNPLLIRFENLAEHSTCINMKLWSSKFMCLEPILFLFLKQASLRTNNITFIDHCTCPEKQDICMVKPMALGHVIEVFLTGQDTELLKQKAKGSKDEALVSVITKVGFNYNKYLEQCGSNTEQPQKRSIVWKILLYVQWAAFAGLIYWACFVNNG